MAAGPSACRTCGATAACFRGVLGVVSALPIVAYSFAGVEMIGLTAGEAREPQKMIPRAINSVLWRILIFYVGALFIIMALYPWHEASMAARS